MKLYQLTFEEIYLIFFNDFLTIEKMAETYKVPIYQLKYWIECGSIENQKISTQ